MIDYFKSCHELPGELIKMIFSYCTLKEELQQVVLKPTQELILSPFNTVFFRNWEYISGRLDETGSYYVFDNNQQVRAMYILH